MPDLVRCARPSLGIHWLAAALSAATMAGCASWFGTEPILQNELVAHYNKMAMDTARVDLTNSRPETPAPSLGPGRELSEPKRENRWLLTLNEALRMGIENNSVIRQNGQFMAPNNPLMRSPDTVPTIFDPGIQNSGVLFGSRGVDAALSDFDPRVTVTMKSGNDTTFDNTTNLAPPNQLLDNNYTQMQSKIEQQLLTGGVFSVNQNWNYGLSNQPAQIYNSAYTGALGAEFRQPLWQGAGTEFTSIAGPSTQRARGFSLVSQGIVIAHINKKLSEIDLLENLQNLAREIGDLYWDLYQNYQDYEAEHATSKVAKELWERMTDRREIDPGADVAQAEDAYFESRSREEMALSNLFITEGKLRRLLGLPIDDERLIYPCDEPREEDLDLNRAMCLYEALCNRTELIRQKTNLHSLELQLSAARKLVAPKLDFVSGYGLNGFGNNFVGPSSSGMDGNNYNNAVANLFTGKETSWNAGFEYSIPLWLRQEKAQVRQLELRIVKARKALAAQEDEIAHELNQVLMTVKRSHAMSKTLQRRMLAARRRVLASQSEYEAGSKSNDLYLRALTSQSQARVAYARSISEYNKGLRDLLFRTGRLLTADGIALMGVDGLPVVTPPNPDGPFPDLPKPSDPDAPAKPKTPDDKPEPKPAPRKKEKPVAENNGGTLSAVLPDFELEIPPRPEDPTDFPEDRPAKDTLKLRNQFTETADEFDDTVIPASASGKANLP